MGSYELCGGSGAESVSAEKMISVDLIDDFKNHPFKVTDIFIMSEHRCYKEFLFDQLGKILPIDYQKIIEASTCIENNVFEIYKKA